MNLTFLSFFRSLQSHPNKHYAVIGLGRFGRAVCMTLHQMGYEVLGVDVDEKQVAQALTDRIAVRAVQLDTTDPTALKEAGLCEIHTVIVAIGNYVEESVITTLNLKEAGVPHVIAKASSQIHEKLLKRVGADLVVFPEHEMGCTLACALTTPNILERFELDPDNSMVEVVVPKAFDGKTIAEVKLRSYYGLNLLAVSREGKFEINPAPSSQLQQGAVMVVIGCNKDIDRLPV